MDSEIPKESIVYRIQERTGKHIETVVGNDKVIDSGGSNQQKSCPLEYTHNTKRIGILIRGGDPIRTGCFGNGGTK